ncbi:alpha/beta hydrolase [uncultured Brevundimonas sp.]|uniref:alpha/beta hydrolase n=1 Tax=uncultured Brevundimonas sp. TaxID=213418 RepID=UPI0030EDD0EE|tara:strand:- start:105316 stop:106128 length:813 start_codon:yes stop_codon:yes gene_type:complete
MSLEAQYNNRALVPDHPAVMARWRESAGAARAATPPQKIAYGPGDREYFDLFEAGSDALVVVFLHGGYWQALDPGWFSGIAPAFLAHGVSLAIPSYDLCPDVRLGQILRQVRAAVEAVRERSGRRPVVFGHSAGGHMAACMLSEGRAGAAVAISGVFDLAPLIPTSLNDALRLDAAEAAALSPIHWPVPDGSTPGGTVLDCVVGGEESAEFLRQSRMMADLWGGKGVETRYDPLPGLNHFTVLDPLFDTDSALVKRIIGLAGDRSRSHAA